MKYSPKVYLLAEAEISKRRAAAENEQMKHLEEVKAIAPQITEVDKRIKGLNFELLKAITNKSSDMKASEMVMQIKENNRLAHDKKAEILKSIGYPEDYLDTKYYCEECSDRGEHDGFKCKCFKDLLRSFSFKENSENCDIMLHDFDEFCLDYYPNENTNDDPHSKMSLILNKSISYANSFSPESESLFMIGNTGLGKTFLCSCIAKKVIENGNTVVFRSILKVFEDVLAEHYGKKSGDTLGRLMEADLVILDDLGSEFSDKSDPILYQILNDRINLHKPMILTSNMSIQQINKRYNERIVSRLFGEFVTYTFAGNDIRIEKQYRRSQNGF